MDIADTPPLRKSTIRKSIKQRERTISNTEPSDEEIKNDNVLVQANEDENDDDLRDDLFNPYWIEDKDLKKSKFEVLSSQEIIFWKGLIKNYLTPLEEDEEKKKETKKNLKELRDKMVVTFFMLNALFVVVVFLLQVNKDQIHIKWPLGAKANITFNKISYEINIQKQYLQLEPVGLTFISFFASVLVIQFVAMVFHRFETLCHLLSSTPLTILQRKSKSLSYREKLENAKKQFNIQNQEQNKRENFMKESIHDEIALKFTENISEKRSKPKQLNEMYKNILKEINDNEERESAVREERRRSSILPWKRNSNLDKSNTKEKNAFTNLALEKIDE